MILTTSTPKITSCRLCGKDEKLQRSHLLPRAAHLNTKQGTSNVLIGTSANVFRRVNQKDFVERLLCFKCEQSLSTDEKIAMDLCRVARGHRHKPFYEIPTDAVTPLIAFAYSVFWRFSVATSMAYNLDASLEQELSTAFVSRRFPDPSYLPISMSFLRVLDIPETYKTLMSPWACHMVSDVTVHFFSMLGIVFRMHVPNAMYELNESEFLRAGVGSGRIYHVQQWEQELIDATITHSAVRAKMEGA